MKIDNFALTPEQVSKVLDEASKIKARSEENGMMTLWEDGKLDGMIVVLNIVDPRAAEAVLAVKQA